MMQARWNSVLERVLSCGLPLLGSVGLEGATEGVGCPQLRISCKSAATLCPRRCKCSFKSLCRGIPQVKPYLTLKPNLPFNTKLYP